MPKYLKLLLLTAVVIFFSVRCYKKNDGDDTEQTILKGNVTIVTDETLKPIIEDQIEVFESDYDATIKLIAKSEAEAVNALLNNTVQIAILSRKLTSNEMNVFNGKKIIPKVTPFAVDAVALIANNQSRDTIVDLKSVIDIMQGKNVAGINGLVFDNPNSSTARYLMELAGVKALPAKGVFSFNNNDEAIRYVAENDGMVGVVGLNWLSQPQIEMQKYVDKVSILAVKDVNGARYYSPTQNNIAEGKYPLARDLFVVDCQGFQGLGIGFASFVAGERGQRIILKSGLLPVRIPGRKIIVRKQIEKETNN